MLGLIRKAAVAAIVLGSTVVSAQTRLQGAGATFPNPLYQRWVSEYQTINPSVQIDYQSIGSGGGIKGITEKTIDFAGSDAPMNKKEFDAAGGKDNLVQVPTTAGAVVPAYNLPGVSGEVKFTGELLADIFAGKVSVLNDAKLVELNPGVSLPELPITPAYRTDGSGTTFVWSNYLATQSDSFKSSVGAGKSVKWPTGQGGKGNEGVAAIVQSTEGSLGYIELNYALQNKISFGAIKNKEGKFVKATPAAVSAAGAGAVDKMTGSVLSADIWNQAGAESYPAAAFTYIIFYKDLNNVKSKEHAQALVDFVYWATHKGQAAATSMDYAPLAGPVQAKVVEALSTVTFKGEPIKPSMK